LAVLAGREFHAALMVKQASQHREYSSQCMDRLGRDYEMKRFDAIIPNQGFKMSLLCAKRAHCRVGYLTAF